MRLLRLFICAALIGGLAWPVTAAESPVDWPCQQSLVPEVSAAVLWAGPPVEGLEGSWRKSPPVAALVARLGRDRHPLDEAERDIEQFAKGLPAAEKDRQLTLLFVGMLESANARRAELMSGIRKLTRQQQELARQIDNGLSEIERLSRLPDGAAQAAELRDKLAWGQRLFDQREKALPHLCETPVLVEERLGEIARAIAARLD
jgi:hypothetical protein